MSATGLSHHLRLDADGDAVERALFESLKALEGAGSFIESYYAQHDLLEIFSEAARKAGTLVGQNISHQIADGKAYYVITAENPDGSVTIRHVPIGDAYQIPAWGRSCNIERAQAESFLRSQGSLRALFGGQKTGQKHQIQLPIVEITPVSRPARKTSKPGVVSQAPSQARKPVHKPAVSLAQAQPSAFEIDYFRHFQGLDGNDERQQAFIDSKNTAAKAGKSLIGRIVTHPYADSHAVYVVVAESDSKVLMRVVPVGDAWVLPAWGERPVVDRDYVVEDLRAKDALSRMFSRRKKSASKP